eukprot:TRINITY_DN12712_c0_g1_i1.p1 TRINITY_DN12712_c0_g1~~TRINITY_DN12712_c0_g1_i1.p1  ORF type:complete len:695 (-),score=197.22 TRINITY_DN12712_c0_g1_i1:90-2090(-)
MSTQSGMAADLEQNSNACTIAANTISAQMIAEEQESSHANEIESNEELARLRALTQEQPATDKAQRSSKLKELLDKAQVYSVFLSEQLRPPPSSTILSSPPSAKKRSSSKRKQPAQAATAAEAHVPEAENCTFAQPALISGGTMRSYQLAGVEWLISLYENGLNGILADEMGLGKTVQTIALLAHLRSHGVQGPHLIVAPLSVLPNWIAEINRWTQFGIPSLLYHGDKATRKHVFAQRLCGEVNADFPVVVTSYEIILRDRALLRKLNWKYIVVDEGHRLKNMDCRLILELKKFTSSNRLLLTGTPLQNSLAELWSLLNFLLPDVFNDLQFFTSWFDFATVDGAIQTDKVLQQERDSALVTKLHTILRPFVLRRLKSEVEVEMPPLVEIPLHVPLSARQQSVYADLIANVRPSQATVSLLNTLMQLRKCCNHPWLFEGLETQDMNGAVGTGDALIQASSKLQLLDRVLPLLKARGHRVLLFSQMTRMLDILQDFVVYRNYSFCRIDGSTAASERQQLMDLFNTDPTQFCFLLSTRAGGLGLNLTAADCVIIYDSDWNPHVDLQAQARAHRIGQQRTVRVYRLVTTATVEMQMLHRAATKLRLERLVVHKKASATQLKHQGAKGLAAMDEAELAQLLHWEPQKAVDDMKLLKCGQDELLKRLDLGAV